MSNWNFDDKLYLWKSVVIFTAILLLSPSLSLSQGIGINNANPDASAILDLTATDRGLLVPRMTQTQRDAITSPATGLFIFQTDVPAGYYFYDGNNWLKIITTAESKWDKAGNYVYNTSDSIGIGTSSPQQKLHINGALQTKYLYPGLGNSVDYQYLIFGDPTVSWGGLMHNISSTNYGNGDDFTIYTYGGRDLVLRAASPGEVHIPFGNVGIGTTSPSTKLEVSGQIKITGGTPGANKVLTSDADGLATWETSPGAEEKQDSNISATGWYRIAECTGGSKRANARFILTDKISGGGHSTVEFKIGISYSRTQSAHFILLSNSYYVYNTFTKVRLLTKGTYDPMYLEVYVTRTGNVYSNMSDNINTDGWNSVDWTAGSIASGYTDTEYLLEGQFGVGRNSESMYVDTDGNVGIGKNNPTALLDINGNVRIKNNANILADGNGFLQIGTTTANMKFGGDPSWSYIEGSSNHLSLQTSRDGDDVVFKGGDAITEYMRIESGTGNVGIGTTTPSEKLHIAGSLRLTETIKDVNNEGGTNGQVLTSTGTALDWVDASALNDGDWSVNSNDIYNANSGGVSVGTNSNSITLTGDIWSPENVIAKLNVITPSSNTTMDVGIHNELSSNTSNSGFIAYGFYNKITTPSLKTAIGIYNKADSTSTSSRIGIFNQALGKSTSSNTVQGINNVVLGTGTGTTYAIFTENKSTGSGTNYNIYATDGINYMKDNLGLGLSIPSEKLDIDGIVRLRSVSAPSTTTERLYNSGGNLYWNGTQLNSTTSNSFTNGGNSFGGIAVLGTNDNYRLDIETENTVRMSITNAGNIGIGTNDPKADLHIENGSTGSLLIGNSTYGYKLRSNVSTTNNYGLLIEDYASGYDIAEFRHDGINSRILFRTNNTDRFLINGSGNVGIGTTQPSTKLNVFGQHTQDDALRITHTHHSIADNSSLGLHDLGYLIQSIDFQYKPTSYSTVDNIFSKIATKNYNEDGTGWYDASLRIDAGLSFFTSENGVLGERLTIQDDGKIGIGTTSPATTLDVEGDLTLENGTSINEFSTDGNLAGNSDNAVPTEKAVKTYIDAQSSGGDNLGSHSADEDLDMNGYDIIDVRNISIPAGVGASDITLQAQNGTTVSNNWGYSGGDVNILAGDGAGGLSQSGNGGNIILQAGNGASGIDGNVGIGTTDPKVPLDIPEMGGLILGLTDFNCSETVPTSYTKIDATYGKVVFKAPSSGNVLIEVSLFICDGTGNSFIRLIDQNNDYHYNAYNNYLTMGNGSSSVGYHWDVIPFIITGLTAGTEYTMYPEMEGSSGNNFHILGGMIKAVSAPNSSYILIE